MLYKLCRNEGMRVASSSDELATTLGQPISPGPWYNATIAQAARGRIVHCTLPVSGPNACSDISVSMMRTDSSGLWSVLAYLFGTSSWELLSCSATLPADDNGTLPRQHDLLAKGWLFPYLHASAAALAVFDAAKHCHHLCLLVCTADPHASLPQFTSDTTHVQNL